jgi:hypothetical protein
VSKPITAATSQPALQSASYANTGKSAKSDFFRLDFPERRQTFRKPQIKPENSLNADYSTAIRRSSAESPGFRKTAMRIAAQIKRRNNRKYCRRHNLRKANGKCFWKMFLPDDRQILKSTEAGGSRKAQRLRNSKNPKPESFAANAAKSSANQQQACSDLKFSAIIHQK